MSVIGGEPTPLLAAPAASDTYRPLTKRTGIEGRREAALRPSPRASRGSGSSRAGQAKPAILIPRTDEEVAAFVQCMKIMIPVLALVAGVACSPRESGARRGLVAVSPAVAEER